MRIDVKNQSITVTEFKQMVSGSVGQYVSEISFSSEWATYDRFIVFASVDMSRKTILTIATGQTSVVIPWEILDKPGLIRIGAYGLRGTDARPTVWSNPIMIATGLYPPDLSDPEDFGKPPTMLPWEELARRIGELSNLDTEDKSNLVAAINELFEHSVGTMHHNELMNRDAPDQHPISAIEGLDEALAEKADAEDIPEKTSDLTNDSGFITAADIPAETDPTVPAWAKEQTKPTYTAQEVGALPDDTFIPEKTSDLTNDSGFITEDDVPSALSELTDDSTHRLVTDAEKDGWNAKYSKPSGGIPKTDLASAVQDSLGLADTALQEHQSLAAYRTSADQDVIDAGKESKGKITISGVEKTANTHTVTIVTNGVTTNLTLVGVS